MRFRFIVNPVAGRGRAGRAWPEIAGRLNALGLDYEVYFTKGPRDAERAARAAAEAGCDVVVAGGGDGTVTEVVNGLVGTQAALGVLPLGSGNDFARTLGLPKNPAAAADLLLQGRRERVDLGRIRDRFFVNIASAGLDAEIVRTMNEDLRHLRGSVAYFWATMTTILRFNPTEFLLDLDGRQVQMKALLVAVANGRFYGGGMKIAPEADVSDGLFDVCILGELSRPDFLKSFPTVYAGKHLTHPKITLLRAQRVRVDCLGTEPKLSGQADGEMIGQVPFEFAVEPQALEVYVPGAAAEPRIVGPNESEDRLGA